MLLNSMKSPCESTVAVRSSTVAQVFFSSSSNALLWNRQPSPSPPFYPSKSTPSRMPVANFVHWHSASGIPLSPLAILRGNLKSNNSTSASVTGPSSSSSNQDIAFDAASIIAASKSTLSEYRCEWRSCGKRLNCWTSLQKACFPFCPFSTYVDPSGALEPFDIVSLPLSCFSLL